MIPSPSEVGAEEVIGNLVLWLKLAVETIGALVIGLGMLLAAGRFVAGFPPAVLTFADVRLTLARFLAIALEFQLGADILSTVCGPDMGCNWQASRGCHYSDGPQLFSQPRYAGSSNKSG
jgi:uncharacterized membrane protein